MIKLESSTIFTETFSLIMVLLAFVLFARFALRSKSVRSLQFGLFLFALVLVVSEVPHILGTLGLLNLGLYETQGLLVHTVAMGILSLAIIYRFYRLLRPQGGKAGAGHG